MEFAIRHTWDSNPVDHDPIRIIFSPGQGGLKMQVSGPFFNDPAAPPGPPGHAFPGLWDYEGRSADLKMMYVWSKLNSFLDMQILFI